MISINENTKIAELLKGNPGALNAIISLSPKLNKLKNPMLRKLMAGRTSISTASKVAGCSVRDFFRVLEPLGFSGEELGAIDNDEQLTSEKPQLLAHLTPGKTIELDVRPYIESGNDPLKVIMAKVKLLKPGMVLKLINSFEPTPLIALLGNQGFESYVETIADDHVITYFYRNESAKTEIPDTELKSDGWDDIFKRFEGKVTTVDVRALEMPQPMMTILEALETLPEDFALFVYHKRIPVFLLPELAERHFDYRVKQISDSEVHLLIFKG